ncbi:helix-turn-helix transcriptional regulator [Gordonibacter sp.]|uniref:helix-turn-helix transcriptional regulator n=1 Tax=Gordonibacter sp. TaxID=1968902 RepID=UPI003FA60C97
MVALHLTRGYTLPQTADMLCVSLDTVRTHVKSLYKKLGIHKKQSLIAIVEEKRQAPQ